MHRLGKLGDMLGIALGGGEVHTALATRAHKQHNNKECVEGRQCNPFLTILFHHLPNLFVKQLFRG